MFHLFHSPVLHNISCSFHSTDLTPVTKSQLRDGAPGYQGCYGCCWSHPWAYKLTWRPTCLGGAADGARWCGREPLVRRLLSKRQNCSHHPSSPQSKRERGVRTIQPSTCWHNQYSECSCTPFFLPSSFKRVKQCWKVLFLPPRKHFVFITKTNKRPVKPIDWLTN